MGSYDFTPPHGGTRSLFFGAVAQAEPQITGICGVLHSRAEGDQVLADHPLKLAIEVLHTVGVAVHHRIQQAAPFFVPLLDVLPSTKGRFQHFMDGSSSRTVLAWHQALRNKVAESGGNTNSNCLLLRKREGSDDSFDSFRSVN